MQLLPLLVMFETPRICLIDLEGVFDRRLCSGMVVRLGIRVVEEVRLRCWEFS
jgi:hypothetical protein